MTTISPLRASTYWRERFLGIAASLHAELHPNATYACYERRKMALERLMMAGMRDDEQNDQPIERIVEFYPASHYTRFIPGKPALVADEVAQWALLAKVRPDGRLSTINAVAVWVTT